MLFKNKKIKNNKTLIAIFLVIFLQILAFGTTSKAALESNGNTPATKPLASWLNSIRKMEAAGGTLGLSETINDTTLLGTSDSNSLDIHMEKNGEYGIMAILSASSYGNPNPVGDGETTTGNPTGIKINLNKEWVSAGTVSACWQYANADARYKDIYTATGTRKNGDALLETSGWHSSGASTWFQRDDYSGMLRAYSGSLFSFYGFAFTQAISWSAEHDAFYSKSWPSRACIVNGPEL